ncbi:hypothetical protein TNCV_3033731 [Trichonephila clavipes]|nr:hypothetical protein TNCV_3033731 [Trichonephila clavipes]
MAVMQQMYGVAEENVRAAERLYRERYPNRDSSECGTMKVIYLPIARAWLLDDLTDDAVSRLDQTNRGILPKSHVRWLGERGQQPRLSPSASGLDPQWSVSHVLLSILMFWVTIAYLSMNVEIMLFVFPRVMGTSPVKVTWFPAWPFGRLSVWTQSSRMILAPKFWSVLNCVKAVNWCTMKVDTATSGIFH